MVVQSQSRRIKDLEQMLACTKAVTAAFEAREKENQSLREQWEVLTSAALIRNSGSHRTTAYNSPRIRTELCTIIVPSLHRKLV